MDVLDRSGKVIGSSHSHSDRDFSDLDLRGADFSGLELEGACFDGTMLNGATFKDCDLYWANFIDATCINCSFVDADMRGVAFFRTTLTNADFRGAKLCRDALNRATDLCGIDLSKALLKGADITDALYNADTKFPPDFDPLEEGLQMQVPPLRGASVGMTESG